ncbi:MAG: SpoIIE family protein phosphatase [Acidimicrobiales bacterium]|nr:SpoIIE family protein phosphatase [Acidimicrobiales bacterium]
MGHPGDAPGDGEAEAALPGQERFDDLVPPWLFVLRGSPSRWVLAVGVPLVCSVPLFAISRPDQLRPGPALLLAIVLVAALGAWSAAAVCAGLVVLLFWWQAIPPVGSFRIEDGRDLVGLLGMAAISAGLVLGARRVQHTAASVRALDGRLRLHAAEETAQRSRAEHVVTEASAVLDLAKVLAGASTKAGVARAVLDGIDLPMRADNGSVAVVEGKHLRVLAALNALPSSLAAIEQVDITTSEWLGDVLAGRPALVDDREAFAAEHPNARALLLYPFGSWAVVPFRSDNNVGLLSVHFPQPAPVQAHATYFTLLAEILATALERAHAEELQQLHLDALEQAFAERDRIARTLSRMLLPAKLPALPGFSASAWLTPASADEVSGDFYDVFPVGAGDWVAVLGDVCGKGAEAAAVTSLARYAARVAALDSPEAPRIAEVANQALIEDPSELFCTMAVIHFTRNTGTIDVTLAGHPQPRLLSNGSVRRLGHFARPLGLSEYDTQGDRYPFEPGDLVVLFSDGLIERNPDFGEDQLDAALAGWTELGAAAVTSALHELVREIDTVRADDLAVLVIGRDS